MIYTGEKQEIEHCADVLKEILLKHSFSDAQLLAFSILCLAERVEDGLNEIAHELHRGISVDVIQPQPADEEG